jgi:prepilin-type N-terminal cleavage/methylation domain-containing protein
MRKRLQFTVYSLQKMRRTLVSAVNCQLSTVNSGFTLVETMVAISILTVAIIAPMALTTQSLSSAYYARDQITAFHLAQEAIESVRYARDSNILKNALGTPGGILDGLPPSGTPFTIDTTNNNQMTQCTGACPPLRKNVGLYGYNSGSPTQFVRTVVATVVPGSNYDGTNYDEINILVTVSWTTGSFKSRSFTISENLFKWVNDGSAAP